MIVGILKEIKTEENRVCMTPAGVEQMVAQGHKVRVETTAGEGSGFSDEAYANAGAAIADSPKAIYDACEMVMKVKEPLPVEYDMIRQGQIVFTYFHFAASEELTRAIMARKCIAIAYETVEKANGSLPLLTPMSEVAGRMAIQEGAKYLEKTYGGKGVLLSGVPGVNSGTVVVIGGGVAGTNAADGVPCDEGAGDDNDECNSSCQSGVCDGATAPTCDDGVDQQEAVHLSQRYGSEQAGALLDRRGRPRDLGRRDQRRARQAARDGRGRRRQEDRGLPGSHRPRPAPLSSWGRRCS